MIGPHDFVGFVEMSFECTRVVIVVGCIVEEYKRVQVKVFTIIFSTNRMCLIVKANGSLVIFKCSVDHFWLEIK